MLTVLDFHLLFFGNVNLVSRGGEFFKVGGYAGLLLMTAISASDLMANVNNNCSFICGWLHSEFWRLLWEAMAQRPCARKTRPSITSCVSFPFWPLLPLQLMLSNTFFFLIKAFQLHLLHGIDSDMSVSDLLYKWAEHW